ncbi:MAG: hypothetical protein R3D98_09955 [Candidatus Krumholzibacteriia bacterium]
MRPCVRSFRPVLAGLLLLALVSAGLADERDGDGRLVIVDDHGGQQVITLRGNAIEVVSEGPDGESVRVFDLAALEPILDEAVGSALAGLSSALDALRAEDFHIDLDQDMITVAHGDQVRAVNVRALARTIDQVLTEALADLDGACGTSQVRAAADEDVETAALRQEVADLKVELQRLQEELHARR